MADILWSHSFSSIISFSMYSFHESVIPFLSAVTLPDSPFRQFDPVISCLSFTVYFATRKISFCWSGSFKSRAHSFCFFCFAKEITLFAFCLLFLYSFHACVNFFSNFHTFSSFSLLLQQLPHSTTMFPYACMGILTIHMWPVLYSSLYFSSVASVHLHQSISTLLPLPYFWPCFGILRLVLHIEFSVVCMLCACYFRFPGNFEQIRRNLDKVCLCLSVVLDRNYCL